MRAYSESYLNDTKNNLADFFDYAVRDCKLNPEYCLPFIRSALFRKNLFPRTTPLFTGQDGHWQNINGVRVNGLKIFFPEFPFQKSFPCILYITKWI